MKIGVFDSGVGGRSFVDAIEKRFPEAEVLFIEDKENLPYGNKSPQELLALTVPLFHQFVVAGCDAVLIACNTVTTTIIHFLREEVAVPLVGVEPMIKPAAEMTRTKIIAVCATPATLNSKRYAELKRLYASGVEVVEPDCSNWAYMIEHNRQNELALTEMMQDLKKRNVDVLVLGCTHYHWIQEELQELTGQECQVIQPIEPVLNQLERVLQS
jgi:glutamate racemase